MDRIFVIIVMLAFVIVELLDVRRKLERLERKLDASLKSK